MARKKKRKKTPAARDKAATSFWEGFELVQKHPVFSGMASWGLIQREESKENICPKNGWSVVTSDGVIWVHPRRLASAEQWAYVIAHSLLHLGFDHFRGDTRELEWVAACEVFTHQFLRDLKLGNPPGEMTMSYAVRVDSEEKLYRRFKDNGVPKELVGFGTAGPSCSDFQNSDTPSWQSPDYWTAKLAEGVELAVQSAVNVAAGLEPYLGADPEQYRQSHARRARKWFIDSYPLLGGLAASFELIEDPVVCQRIDVPVAAVHSEAREIYINPAAGLTYEECKFVMAHEFLHAGLRHETRRYQRDTYLWNVACDFVVNGWLVEMGIGERPGSAILYDPDLQGQSAESIYDRIASDLRRARKLATLRGENCKLGDMLGGDDSSWWQRGEGVTLDEFYRRCLAQGLSFHEESGRGFLPAGLVEEIKALSQPPVPWDVELAQWFDHHFPPLEKRRTYGRPSRRQSSTPEIPRPSYQPVDPGESRTFGVVLDTSGSMDRSLLAKALGAIASYCNSRDVFFVRVVFCDAEPYDQGYMSAEDIAGRVQVKGRGGTILQPGIRLLEKANDFPDDGPILIITDGFCDVLKIRREHAYLIPTYSSLPFAPKGKVFRIN